MRIAAHHNLPLLVLAALGLVGLLGAIALRDRSFPVASVDFRVLATDAERLARDALATHGFAVDGYSVVTAFSVDDGAKNYVHRTAGLAELNRLARDELAIWRWQVRFFREREQEEYSVFITPDGRLVGLSHSVPEATEGASLSPAEAERLAQTFFAAREAHADDYALVTSSSTERDRRVDHFFTWEDSTFKIGEATRRVDVWLHGDRLGGFHEYLKVPEQWRRSQAVEANRGNVLAVAGWALTYALALAMAFVVLWRLRVERLNWRFAVALAAAVAAIGVATGLNSLPLVLIDYPTTSSLSAYLAGRAVAHVGSLLPSGVAVVLAALAGEHLYRKAFPRKATPSLLLGRRGPLHAEFVTALLAGYAIAGIWLGYVTVFYAIAGQLFGAWSPAEVPYRDIMSTLVPGLYPLTVGVGAAVSEELMFRLFSVPLLVLAGWQLAARFGPGGSPSAGGRLARWLIVGAAVVIPAAIWGSLHATYPQQPFYIRALELTIVGTVSALVMARFGILATVTAHYVYNASVIGGLFLLSGSRYLQVSAVVVVCMPLLLLVPAAVRRFRGNPLLVTPPHVSPETVLRRPVRLSPASATAWVPSRRALLPVLLLAAASLLVSLVWRVPRLGDSVRVGTTAAQASAAARTVAEALSLDPATYLQSTTYQDWSGGSGTTYLLRRLGTGAADKYLVNELGGFGWETRFFRPLERTELSVRVDIGGRFHGLDLRLPEEAEGARLDQAQARALAEAFVRARGRAEALAWTLVSASSQVRPARTDHVFEWENQAERVGEAALRLRVAVKGDRVGEYAFFLKVPEAFERELASRGLPDLALDLLRESLSLIVLVVAVVLFALRFRADRLDLRFAAAAAGAMAALDVLGWLNSLPSFFSGYWTTIDLEGYVAWRVVDFVRALGGDTVWRFVLFAVGESLYRDTFPARPTLAAQAWSLLRPGRAEAVAGMASLVLAPVFWLLLAAYRAAREAFAWRSLGPEGTVPGYTLDALLAPLAVWQGNLAFALWVGLGGLAVTLGVWKATRRRWAVAALWTLGLTVLYAGRAQEYERLLVEALRWVAFVGLVWLVATRALGPTLTGYVLALFVYFAGRDALFLLSQPEPGFALMGAVALAGVVTPSLWLAVAGLARGRVSSRFDSQRGP